MRASRRSERESSRPHTHALCISDNDVFSDPASNSGFSFERGGAAEPFNSRCQMPWPLSKRSHGNLVCLRSLADTDGGARRDRTDDLMLAKHPLYQLSYGPSSKKPATARAVRLIRRPARGVTRSVVGPGRLELPTSRLSGVCSNQLSYRPVNGPLSARRSIRTSSSAECAIAPLPRRQRCQRKEKRRRRHLAPD
jgi:hypothetical protein